MGEPKRLFSKKVFNENYDEWVQTLTPENKLKLDLIPSRAKEISKKLSPEKLDQIIIQEFVDLCTDYNFFADDFNKKYALPLINIYALKASNIKNGVKLDAGSRIAHGLTLLFDKGYDEENDQFEHIMDGILIFEESLDEDFEKKKGQLSLPPPSKPPSQQPVDPSEVKLGRLAYRFEALKKRTNPSGGTPRKRKSRKRNTKKYK